MRGGLALPSRAVCTATYSNTPVFRVIATMIIMPVRRPIVLKSTERIASSCERRPVTITMPAPSSATTERLIRSVMIVR